MENELLQKLVDKSLTKEDLLRKVCEIRTDKGMYYANLAICLAEQGKYKEALLAFDCSIELEPENETFLYNKKAFELALSKESMSTER